MAEQNGTTPVLTPPPIYGGNLAFTNLDENLDLDSLSVERGTTGLRRTGGFVREELLTELSGARGMRVFRQMAEQDEVVASCLLAIQMLIRNVTWRMQPADESQLARQEADFVEGALFRDLHMPWSMLLAEILSMLPFGHAYFEIVYKRRLGYRPPQQLHGIPYLPSLYNDGLLGWGKISIRAQETLLRWEFDQTGGLMGMHQLDPYSGRLAYIPYEKAALFRPTSWKENPEGHSILRGAYRSFYLKNHLQQVESIGAERDLAGLPVFYVPPQWMSRQANADQQAQLSMVKTIGRNVRNDEQSCLVLPAIWDDAGHQLLKFELAASGGHRNFDTDKIIARYDLRMAQSMLADLIFLGHEAVGSFALASSKTNILSMALGGYLEAIVDVFNRRLIPQLWRLNGKPEATMPTAEHGDVEAVDFKDLGQLIKDMAQSGFDVLDLDNHVRLLAGFPERPDPVDTPFLKRRRQPHPPKLAHGRQLVLPFAA